MKAKCIDINRFQRFKVYDYQTFKIFGNANNPDNKAEKKIILDTDEIQDSINAEITGIILSVELDSLNEI